MRIELLWDEHQLTGAWDRRDQQANILSWYVLARRQDVGGQLRG